MLGPASLTSAASPAAVIYGSAVNQDGRSSGLTAPNGPSQTALIREALQASASAAASDVTVAAVHGTGTPLGDPVEVGALGGALRDRRSSGAVAMVSVKACYGHTEGAAGLTGTSPSLCRIGTRELSVQTYVSIHVDT